MQTIDATRYPCLQMNGELDPALVEGSTAIVSGPEDQIAHHDERRGPAVYGPRETPRPLADGETLVLLTW